MTKLSTAEIDRPANRSARWSLRAVLFAVKLVLTALVLHRFASLPSATLASAIVAGMGIAVVAAFLALVASAQIWRRGERGGARAFLSLALSAALLGWPAPVLMKMRGQPPIHDISTNPASPPRFVALSARREDENPATHEGARVARLQAEAYPDIKPLIVTRAVADSFAVSREIIRRQGWEIIAEDAPAGPRGVGTLEAQSRTPILGFRDDIVLRLDGDQARTRIDIRSASRFGKHDLGRNAERVAALLDELHKRLDLNVPLEPDTARGRRRQFRQSLLQARDRGSAALRGKPADRAQSSAPRGPEQKAARRSQDERRDPDKRRRRSQE
jgi:hypothetical protein